MGRRAVQVIDGLKHCARCKAFKAVTEFSKMKTAICGLCTYCKDCRSQIKGSKRRRQPVRCYLDEKGVISLAALVETSGNFTIIERIPERHYQVNLKIRGKPDACIRLRQQVGFGWICPRRTGCYLQFGANGLRSLLPLLIPWLTATKPQAKLISAYLADTRNGKTSFEAFQRLKGAL